MSRFIASLLLLCAISLLALRSASAVVTIDWIPVGNPGNANDTADGDEFTDGIQNFGAVAYNYNIDKYDVTNAQYAEFLNTKDPTGANTLGLWNNNMTNATYGGISFNNSNANGSKYVLTAGRQDHPVTYVNWYDTIRFANWLNNGQGNGDTESGAYTLLGGTPIPSNGNSITRNSGATTFLPSEDEWYKAAYYNPGTNSYFQYATGTNSAPIASSPTGLANHANYNLTLNDLTDVGAYTGTTSPYGAFDMNGDAYQWDEGMIGDSHRVLRGGSFGNDGLHSLRSSYRDGGLDDPSFESGSGGFRVTEVPEPSTAVLAVLGFASIATWARRRRSCSGGI